MAQRDHQGHLGSGSLQGSNTVEDWMQNLSPHGHIPREGNRYDGDTHRQWTRVRSLCDSYFGGLCGATTDVSCVHGVSV